jgi:hypothetical protein
MHAGYEVTAIHSEYVRIIAWPQQQWLHECASMLLCSILRLLFIQQFILRLFTFVSITAEIRRLTISYHNLSMPIPSIILFLHLYLTLEESDVGVKMVKSIYCIYVYIYIYMYV